MNPNGKIERWHQTLKASCLRPGCPLSLKDAQHLVKHFVTHYNTVRLHSAIGYITPANRLAARKSLLLGTKGSMQPAKTVN
jgi:transposase InsO family protein